MKVYAKMIQGRFSEEVFSESGMNADKHTYFDVALKGLKESIEDYKNTIKDLELKIGNAKRTIKTVPKNSNLLVYLDDLYQRLFDAEAEKEHLRQLLLHSSKYSVIDEICDRYLKRVGITYTEIELNYGPSEKCEEFFTDLYTALTKNS